MHRRGQRDGREGGASGGEGGSGGGGAQHQVQLLPLTRRGGTAHAGEGHSPVPSERKKKRKINVLPMLNINLVADAGIVRIKVDTTKPLWNGNWYRYRTDLGCSYRKNAVR
jgi:hypothetical protein